MTASLAGSSAFGVAQMVGNGWQWTNSVFAPFPGFQCEGLVSRLFGKLLRQRALCDERRLAPNAQTAIATIVPELVPPRLPLYLRDVPLRGELESDMLASAQQQTSQFASDVAEGLSRPGQKKLAPRYFYDDLGKQPVRGNHSPARIRTHARR